MLARFADYLERTWEFSQVVESLEDSRLYPKVPASAIFLSLFGMFATRLPSLNALEGELRLPRRWEPWVGPRKPSADTLGYALDRSNLKRLRSKLVWINHQMKRKKILRSHSPPYFVAALDGHELFSSFKRCCNKCLMRKIETNKGKAIQYYHRVAVLQIIDARPSLILDIEPVLPGEGEVAAAERLLDRARKLYPRFFDVISADALYLGAPFIKKVKAWGWDVIVVLKQENRDLYQDANGLLAITPSQEFQKDNIAGRRWNLEKLVTWSQLGRPIRAVVEQYQENRRERIAGQWRETVVDHHWRWVTTLSGSLFTGAQVSRWGHARWDIENRGFNDLASHWAMDHCFHHHPTAILACLLILAMAFVLTRVFFERNLKPQFKLRLNLTRMALARLFFDDLAKQWTGSFWAHPP